MTDGPIKISEADLQQFEKHYKWVGFYSDRLKFLWEQYIKAVHLMITFAAGTIYLLIKDFKLAENKDLLVSKPLWVWVTIGSAAGSLVFALLWRSLSQIIMEHQIYGLKKPAQGYFDTIEATKPVALREKGVKCHQKWNERVKYLTIACLAIAWGGMIFILK